MPNTEKKVLHRHLERLFIDCEEEDTVINFDEKPPRDYRRGCMGKQQLLRAVTTRESAEKKSASFLT